MSRPRNVVAVYVEGRGEDENARLAQKLSANSAYRPLAGAPAGWLIAVEPCESAPAQHSDDPTLLSIEAPVRGNFPREAAARALREPTTELARLEGDLAFCVFGAGGAVTAVRSCGGLVPLYFHVTATSVCVATRLRDLYWLCPAELELDPLVHAIWSSANAVFPAERTFFRDVRILPRGHFLDAMPGRARTARYWEPRLAELHEPSPALAEQHVNELRRVVLETLREGLSPVRENLLTLSGGVDSSSVAVLASRSLKLPLATLTFVAPAGSPARARQLSYVQPLLEELGIASHHLLDADNDALDRLFEKPLPTLYHCPHPALRVLPELGGYASLVSGHFADEICGYSQRRQDWVRHTRLARLLLPSLSLAYGPRDYLRWAKRRVLGAIGRELLPLPRPLGELVAPGLREEHDAWVESTRRRLLADDRPLRELATWTELDAWVSMHWDVASTQGVVPVHPFFNRAMLELAFQCHPSELYGPGHKKILRRALSDWVPARYLQRADKGHWHRPQRRDRAPWLGQLSLLASCVDEAFRSRARDLAPAERRQLTQLALFEAALAQQRTFRASLR